MAVFSGTISLAPTPTTALNKPLQHSRLTARAALPGAQHSLFSWLGEHHFTALTYALCSAQQPEMHGSELWPSARAAGEGAELRAPVVLSPTGRLGTELSCLVFLLYFPF